MAKTLVIELCSVGPHINGFLCWACDLEQNIKNVAWEEAFTIQATNRSNSTSQHTWGRAYDINITTPFEVDIEHWTPDFTNLSWSISNGTVTIASVGSA